jgi:putative DNA primase/helicase
MNPGAIPEQLRDRDQWLLFDRSADTPRRPHWDGNFNVSWSDPDAWHSFGEAKAKADRRESWGVGYVTAANNDAHPMGVMSVIDIDSGATPEDSKKEWLPGLEPFVDRDCYLEWSASHDEPGDSGIHIPIAGQPPEWWSDTQKGDHEGVDVLSNKFCAFTGDVMEGISGDGIPSWGEWVDEWLADAYEALTGETAPPRRGEGDGSLDSFEGDSSSDVEVDADMAADMLEAIDPDCTYEKWRNIGFALADHFSSSRAERLFREWSRQGSKHDRDAERYIEDIANRGSGGIGIGTLWHHAEQAGWEPEFGDEYEGTPSAEELIARHSDEFDTAEDVPDDIFNQDRAPEPEGDGGEGADSTNDGKPWSSIYAAYKAAGDADERLSPRYEASKQLLAESSWRTVEENDTLWKYDANTGIYRQNGEQAARTRLDEELQEQFRAQEQREIQRKLRARTIIREDEFGGPEAMICTKNCVVEIAIDGVELHEHDPSYNFIGRVETEFDADAECPTFQAFLQDVVTDDSTRRKLQEYAGYCLHHWGLPFHKALFLVGPTASGKSTFLDTIRTMLGGDAVSSLTPQQMSSETFGAAELYGSWANIRNDIPADLIENTGQFKELVAGDPIKAEEKFKDPFMFEPTSKHMFSANELPETETDDRAFYRRILLAAFPTTVPRPERDPKLPDKLEAEHSGILNWAIEGLQRLLANGHFSGDRTPAETEDTWAKWGNSVKRFAKTCIEDEKGSDLPSSEIFQAYLAYCDDEGIPAETEQQLVTKRLKQQGYDYGRPRINGKQTRALLDVGFTGRGEQYRDADADESSSATGLTGF